MEKTVNCAEACVNGCILGDNCPHQKYVEETSKFIDDTALDKMLEIAEAALMKKRMAPPQWVTPDFPE